MESSRLSSVGRALGSGMLDFELKPHQCLYATTWNKMARPPCWLARCHTRGKSEDNVAGKRGNPSWLWNPGQMSLEDKTGVSVAPQKELMFSNFFFTKHWPSSGKLRQFILFLEISLIYTFWTKSQCLISVERLHVLLDIPVDRTIVSETARMLM